MIKIAGLTEKEFWQSSHLNNENLNAPLLILNLNYDQEFCKGYKDLFNDFIISPAF